MMDQHEAYRYTNYIKKLTGSKINILPPTICPIENLSTLNSHYALASSFMESANKSTGGIDDFFAQKKELSEDKVSLILGELNLREDLKNNNLTMLYEDLTRITNWRLERPFPLSYSKDKLWSDLNRSELQIREQIRKELKDAARDAAFPQKDLRESLLDFKLQAQKNRLIEGDLETELEGSYLAQRGDTYSKGLY
jgi:hypothetical protein